MIQYLIDHQAAEYLILFGISELLAAIPGIQANSVFQLLFGWLKSKAGQ